MENKLVLGQRATCEQCGRQIEWLRVWRHVGTQYRHIAKPKKCNEYQLSQVEADQLENLLSTGKAKCQDVPKAIPIGEYNGK